MHKNILFLFSLLFSFHLIGQTVNTQYGPITGVQDGAVYKFLGIPYASPPKGDLRWKPTVAPSPWTNPITANQFPPACPQKQYQQGSDAYTLLGDEDCLYLNVWSPNLSGNLPVMVFIHGGGNQQGSTGSVSVGTYHYDGKNLSQRGNVVIVTIQYRLGALGFLVHPGLEAENGQNTSGNYAVMDQIFALQWVQNNIQNFGGNPQNVTIFGESAGGVNVGNLICSPQAKGLFHKAIIESGVAVVNFYADSKAKGVTFVNSYIPNGTDAEKIAFMRNVIADSISVKNSNVIEGGKVDQEWQPVIDNIYFVDRPENVIESGNFNKAPLIVGTNSEEMATSAGVYPDDAYPSLVTQTINSIVPSALRSTAQSLYPISTNAEAKSSYIRLLTDVQFTVNARRTAQCISANQTQPVWRYFFTHKHTFTGGENLGSYHGMELLYVFNNWENSTLGKGLLFKTADDSVQHYMMKYWTNFAYSGNPNGTLLPTWRAYNSSLDDYMEIKANPNGTQNGVRTAESDLWDQVSHHTPCTSSTSVNNTSVLPLDIFPNPSSGKFFINAENEDISEIKVFNVLGDIIYSDKKSNVINIQNQPQGLYYVFANIQRKIFSAKIVKW